MAYAHAAIAAGKQPRAVFQKLFGQGDTDQERAQILSETGSILDRVQGQARRLQDSLGVQDRNVVGDYLDSVREIERRVQMLRKRTAPNWLFRSAYRNAE